MRMCICATFTFVVLRSTELLRLHHKHLLHAAAFVPPECQMFRTKVWR